jgi:3-oxoacyl-[acyl-carrier protein] reductase
MSGVSEFAGKVAIVTGGAQGMGREYVRLLAEAGAKVVIADVNPDVAEATIAEIGADDRIAFVLTDVGATDACNACAAAAVERFGGIDYLVNNAGLLSAAAHRSLIAVDLEIYHKVLGVMSHGMLYMARAVAPAMQARGGGAIVNVSSIGAYQASGLYSLAKVIVNGLTINLAHEMAESNIRVNAIAPGTVATEGMQPLMSVEQMAAWGKTGGRPTDRVAHPSEIARVGLFLLSDAASYVRGQIIAVDDGQQIRI